jgi:hypothetical protein
MAESQGWEYKTLVLGPTKMGFSRPIWEPTLGVVKAEDGSERRDWTKRMVYFDQALEDLGEKGWELVQIVWRGQRGQGLSAVAIFKRQRTEEE